MAMAEGGKEERRGLRSILMICHREHQGELCLEGKKNESFETISGVGTGTAVGNQRSKNFLRSSMARRGERKYLGGTEMRRGRIQRMDQTSPNQVLFPAKKKNTTTLGFPGVLRKGDFELSFQEETF